MVIHNNGTDYSYFLDDSEDFVNTRLMLDWKVTSATIDYTGRVYYYDLPLWENEPASEPNANLKLLLAQTTNKVPRVPAIKTGRMQIGTTIRSTGAQQYVYWSDTEKIEHPYLIGGGVNSILFIQERLSYIFAEEATIPSSLWLGTSTEKVTKIAELLPACYSDYYLAWIS